MNGRIAYKSSADGISIPASYTAYIAPLSSSKLYNETRASKDSKSSETPYVVMLHAINILSDNGSGISGTCGPRVQECWEFEHPRKDAVLTEQGECPVLSAYLRSHDVQSDVQAFLSRTAITSGQQSSHSTSRTLVSCTDLAGILKQSYTGMLASAYTLNAWH